VRLDHLLSKEHNTSTFPGFPDSERGVAGTQVPNVCLFRLLKESWNYWLWFIAVTDAGVSTDSCWGRGGCWLSRVVDCLLARCWVLRQHASGLSISPGTLFVSGVVFENCRVDASIFVVKLLRAHGGCLGFRSR
jgi:hypothetical protein